MKSGIDFSILLAGGDLRSLRNSKRVINSVQNKTDFERLFKLIYSSSRPVAMRASDAIEKITKTHPEYLRGHHNDLLELARHATSKELKWHLAQLVPRLDLPQSEVERAWHYLNYWACNPNESKIVRVNALQGLYELSSRSKNSEMRGRFNRTLSALETQHVPSLSSRARVLRRQMNRNRDAVPRVSQT